MRRRGFFAVATSLTYSLSLFLSVFSPTVRISLK